MPASPVQSTGLTRDRIVAARWLALFLAIGGAYLTVLALVIPGFAGRGAVLVAVVAIGVLIMAGGAAAWRWAPRVPALALSVVPPLSIALLGAINLMTRDSSTGSQLFLLWPVLYAACFLGRRHTALAVGATIVVEAIVMGTLVPSTQAVTDTLGMAVTFTMVAVAILLFRRRLETALDAMSVQAREDPLTGLPNRRAFDEYLARSVALSQRTGAPLALVALDIDRFKGINDTRGHAAGDRALRDVGEALRGSARGADLVARMGGDEFAMLLPGCSASDAARIASKMAGEVRLRSAAIGRDVTVSVGIAALPDMATTGEQLLSAADLALYAAKREGPGRASVASVLAGTGM
jgi:diguanylate cyclase (GGDEF)-like protein